MSRDRDEKGVGKDFARGLMIASGLPVMVILGVLVGYYVGKDYGPMSAGFGALIGGMLGLLWTAIEAIRLFPSDKKKKNERAISLQIISRMIYATFIVFRSSKKGFFKNGEMGK